MEKFGTGNFSFLGGGARTVIGKILYKKAPEPLLEKNGVKISSRTGTEKVGTENNYRNQYRTNWYQK